MLGAFPEHEFYAWRPRVGDPPPQLTGDPMRRWAWDFLPLAEVCFLFLPGGADRNAPKAGEWMVELRVRVDSGHEGYEEKGEVDPARFDPRRPARRPCGSTCGCVTKGLEETGSTGFGNVGHALASRRTPVPHPEGPFRIVGWQVDLATLPDRASVEAMVAEFRAMATQALGVPLEPDLSCRLSRNTRTDVSRPYRLRRPGLW